MLKCGYNRRSIISDFVTLSHMEIILSIYTKQVSNYSNVVSKICKQAINVNYSL